jgi:hypothetical protein
MHPQHPWMMRLNAEELQRDVERSMRLKQARKLAKPDSYGVIGGIRRVVGLALIAAGDRIQPEQRPAREYDPALELELAR